MSDVELDNQRFTVTSTATGWSISGEIDASTAPRLVEAVEQLPGHDGAIVLDVKDVSFIDSSGLRVLIALAERARGEGRTVELDNPSTSVVRLLEITGLADMFGLGEPPTT
jgi:anti-sigma B factor antagonist